MKREFRNYDTSAAPYLTTEMRMTMPAKGNRKTPFVLVILLAVACLLAALPGGAQTTSASLSGTVGNQTGARIPGAAVVLVNDRSKDKRNTVANSDGIFNFAGVASGTYSLTVTYKGFETVVEKGIQLHPGDDTTLLPIRMKVGAEEITVTVTAHDAIATNGEVGSLITAEDIKHLATSGRDVTDLVKILPGFALQPGSVQAGGGISNTSPAESTIVAGPGGSLGNYAANGAPQGGVGLISEGANVQDPGDSNATTQTINMNMVEEVKVTTSNFGADSAKGPVMINAVGKSGGDAYHGSIYLNVRTYQLNSQDWLLKNRNAPKPQDRYLYPGAHQGGLCGLAERKILRRL
jgi:hypothetical protein